MKFVKYDVIHQIKNNLSSFLEFFRDPDYPEKLHLEFSDHYYDKTDFEYLLIDFAMPDIRQRERKSTDLENAVKLYEAYKNLTESQAADERLWCGLGLEKNNLDYLFYRWGNTINTLRYRLTYHVPGKRGMLYHGLARLWWFVRMTIDETLENKYELTRFTFEHPHIMEKMIYRNFSNSSIIRLAIIKGIKKFVAGGGKYSTTLIDKLYLHISLISGTKLLDIIPQDELVEIVFNFLAKEVTRQ